MQQKKWFLGVCGVRVILVGLLMLGLAGCKSCDDGSKGTEQASEKGDEASQKVERSTSKREVSGTIGEDETWEGEITVMSMLNIEGTVTIKPCTTILVKPRVRIAVRPGGSIQSKGTEDCKITFRSAKDDPAAGDWHYVHLPLGEGPGSVFEHTNFLHAGGGGPAYGALYVMGGREVSVKNVRFESIDKTGMLLHLGAKVGALETIHFEKINGVPLTLEPNVVGKLEGITGSEVDDLRIILNGQGVATDQTWKPQAFPYYLGNSVTVSGSLEIEAGTTLLMGKPTVSLNVGQGGTLKTLGTEDSPVVFQSAKADPAPGDWASIKFGQKATDDSVLKYTTIRHGGAVGGTLQVIGAPKVELDHVVFEGSKNCDVRGKVEANDTVYEPC